MEGIIEEAGLAQRTMDEGRRFAQRMYLPRVFGLALGAVCVGGCLWQQGAHPAVWAALILNTLVWPHLAYVLACRSRNPYRAELRNLMVDSASGGVWIAMLGFNLVPSAVLASMLAMDKVSIGGPRFLGRCLAVQVTAIAVVTAAVAASVGFEVRLESSVAVVVASLPLLIIYPITVGITAHRLARRVRRQNLTLAALSSTDGLTGLLNRMHWEKAVAGEFERCRRGGHQSAVMMIDIDHFKAINDGHGHPAGDEVIRNVARILRGTLRMYDVSARYGGEEFGVVLPGTDAEGSKVIAERIRHRVESSVLDARHGIRATISIGIATFVPGDADHAAWIARADQALYQAKAGGRNRVVNHDPAHGQPDAERHFPGKK
jgi:diguanylate cyclase